ncbi:retinoic acid receptor responder protein 2 [Perognathus longimembris pacificus]|uniref:retinoic acid receptor responder protein 2 n=1 Tax=Perognathus longimembris pacificus TaxID=214514 RepID=UPI002018F597|nr:retinoic acid receptor responder protein 2 [Perognathus longimembris pacificus]
MWPLLVALALWPGTGRAQLPEPQLSEAPLSEPQRRSLQVALEEFHKHPLVHWAFRKTSIHSIVDVPFPAGTFVKMEFNIQQTNCRRKEWKEARCQVLPKGKKRTCLACIKLAPENRVLGRMVHCPLQPQGHQEMQRHHCSKVERAGEDPNSSFLPGQFAFLKSGPST